MTKGVLGAAVLPFLAMLSGCGAGYESDAAQGNSEVDSSEAAISTFDRYALGVIPLNPNDCPEANRVSIYSDDEDSANESDSTGWDAPSTARRARRHDTGRKGTSWTYCKVDGSNFRSLTKFYSKSEYHYAALKLGPDCPNGSAGYARYSVGEFEDNESNITGPAGYNHLEWLSGRVAPDGSVLVQYFCMFHDSTNKMTSFPDLGMPYAVFHDYDGAQPDFVISKKWIYTDDEDDSNGPRGTFPSGTPMEDVIGDRQNTMYEIARVR